MPALTRRRDPEMPHECWRVFYGDVQVGTIGKRSGVPAPLAHEVAAVSRQP